MAQLRLVSGNVSLERAGLVKGFRTARTLITGGESQFFSVLLSQVTVDFGPFHGGSAMNADAESRLLLRPSGVQILSCARGTGFGRFGLMRFESFVRMKILSASVAFKCHSMEIMDVMGQFALSGEIHVALASEGGFDEGVG